MIPALVLAAALIRLAAAGGDLWLDEIWSARAAFELGSWTETFTRFLSNNNHPLNTLWLRALGPGWPATAYRLASVAAGAAAVWAAARLGGARAAALACLSFPLVQYGSEARGYALAVLFAFLAVGRLEKKTEGADGPLAGFCLLGALAHATFAFVWAGAAARLALERRWKALAASAAAVGAAHAAIYARVPMTPVGDSSAPGPVVLAAAARTVAGHDLPWLGALALAGALAGIAALGRRDRPRAAFFAVSIFLAPAAAVAAYAPSMMSERYLLLPAACLLLLLARGLERLPPKAAAAALAAFGAVHLVPAARLIAVGRGGYSDAVRFMAERSPGPVVDVSSDHDFRARMTLEYYAAAAGGKTLAYRDGSSLAASGGPDWVIVSAQPAPESISGAGESYARAAVFPHAGLSGFTWTVYRRR